MLHIGIDVGVEGAIAAVDDMGNFHHLIDLPIVQFSKWKFIDGAGLVIALQDIRLSHGIAAGAEVRHAGRVYLEYATGMHGGSGVMAAASLGRTLGGCVAVCSTLGIPVEMVSPQKWKKTFNIGSARGGGNPKEEARGLAMTKFPGAVDLLQRKKDHNRAEALLIAEYGRRMFAAGGGA